MLGPAQIEAFHENGFLVADRLLDYEFDILPAIQ